MKKLTMIKILLLASWMLAFFECFAQWEYMEPMPTPRALSTSAFLNGKIYVIGGALTRFSDALATVEAYDPKINAWDTSIADVPVPLCGATSQVVDEILYVIGGANKYVGNTSSIEYQTVFAYNLDSNKWVQKHDIPSKRAWHATDVNAGKIYLMGGTFDRVARDDVYMFDPDLNVWEEQPSMPTASAFLATEGIDENIYAMGGLNQGEPKNEVEVFDSDSMYWKSKATLLQPIFHHGSGKLDNQIYVFGGIQSVIPPVFSESMLLYNPLDDNWLDLEIDMPETLAGFTYVTAPDATAKQCIYVIGGGGQSFWTGNDPATNSLLKYAPEKATDWKYMTPMPTPRALTASTLLNGKIYVIGGVFSRTGQATNLVEVYDTETDIWSTDIAPLPEPVCNAIAQGVYHIYDGDSNTYYDRVYVIGGSDYHLGPGKKTTFEYDPEKNEWNRMADMDIPLSGHASTVTQTRIRTIGGIGENGMATNTVLEFFPGQNRWESFSPMEIPRAFSSAVTVTHELREMLVLGGIYLGEPVGMMEAHGGLSPWVNRGEMPVPRYWHGAGMFDKDTVIVYGGIGEGNQPLFDIVKYNWRTDEWFEVEETLPEYSSPFASAVVKEVEQMCFYAIGGPTYDFWNEGNGPLVTGLNLKYCTPIGTDVEDLTSPREAISLSQNFPNPAHNETIIPFELQNAASVTIDLMHLEGIQMATIFSGQLNAGYHSVALNTSSIPNGVYIYRLKTKDGIAVKKLIVQHHD